MTADPVLIAVQVAVGLLVDGEYDALAQMTHGERLSEAEIRSAVEDYGRTLILPPGGDVAPYVDRYEVADTEPRQVNLDVDLWTQEEGRSDLTLELNLVERAPGLWGVRIYGIHVM